MRILMFNWRDINNPAAGGAEVLTHEHMKRWAKAGHKCYLVTSAFPNCKNIEKIEGYTVYRSGNRFSVYWDAYKLYKRYFEGKVDLVIDQINTIPFFTPLYVKEKKMSFFHQTCKEIWFYEVKFPFSLFGYLAESLYLRLYKNYPSMVLSTSTKQDLLNLNFKHIFIIPAGINFKPISRIRKKEKNMLIYVGRLKKSKRIHHIIKALFFVKQKIPDIKLYIMGSGDNKYNECLVKLTKKYDLQKNIDFLGYRNFEKRNELMGKAESILMASIREGWGLTITEANAMGTPAIGYNAPGLRDSIKNGLTGLLSKDNPQALADKISEFLTNKNLKKKLTKNCLNDSHNYSWDKSAKESLNILEMVR